jgi:hypothetical protein
MPVQGKELGITSQASGQVKRKKAKGKIPPFRLCSFCLSPFSFLLGPDSWNAVLSPSTAQQAKRDTIFFVFLPPER